jgi:peptide-methionine (S)-S-oxide reductase
MNPRRTLNSGAASRSNCDDTEDRIMRKDPASALRDLIAILAAAFLLPAVAAEGPPAAAATPAVAIFAGGCFWCMEPPFDKLDGVLSTTSGYIGGKTADPSYEEVSAGRTGHAEAVRIEYDPKKIGYDELLVVFWHNIDPTVANRQFCDVGSQYRSAIFHLDEQQRALAEESKRALEPARFKGRLQTEIVQAATFYPAEEYHQDYYLKNPIRYRYYRTGCGRDARLRQIWDDPAK